MIFLHRLPIYMIMGQKERKNNRIRGNEWILKNMI